MATIVLSAAGAVLGGPIGAAVGAVIGQQVDGAIFAPKARQGPRLGDLAIQTSSYGSAIPKIFGKVRVAGSVIWATDLKEARTTQSNGKGRGSSETYSYSASFAVALSGRRAARIGRIWADGKLLRGIAGDFKAETVFRFHDGGEDQALDPLIAASEGIGAAPAYRGIAYAVFEDMALANFGNRIPSLSFEVVAEEAGTSAGAVLQGLGPISSDGGPLLTGLAATGDGVRGVAQALAQAMPFSTIATQTGLAVRFGAVAPTSIAADDRGASAGAKVPALSVERAAAASLPEVITLAYNDFTRDYLVGAQRARRDGSARREIRVELPAAVDAPRAKAIAEARLSRLWAERSRATVALPWRALRTAPGDAVTVPGLSGRWRVSRVSFEAMVVRLDLVLEAPASLTAPVADAGRNRAQPDMLHGPTTLIVLDLPQMGDQPETAARVGVAANGASGGWRKARLMTSSDGGVTYSDAGWTALPGVIGRTATILNPGSVALFDIVNAVDVQLVHPGLTLNDADDAALLSGVNLALLGDEAVQFGSAIPLGGGRWRLSKLLRGRRGTEWAAVAHAVESPFVLVDPAAIARVDLPSRAAGGRLMALGVGDPTGVVAQAPERIGAAVRPLSPEHLRASVEGSNIRVEWTRRSREGWRWDDGVDAPVSEEAERYRLIKTVTGRADLAVELNAPFWIYDAAERSADAATGATMATVTVQQIGTFDVSVPRQILVPTG